MKMSMPLLIIALSLSLTMCTNVLYCSCLFWQYPLVSAGDLTPGSWGTSMCQPQSHFVLLENYITCTCRQLGDFAAANEVGVGYGWTFPAAVTAAIIMIAMVLVILVHLCYLSGTQLATKILINLCIAVGVFQLMLFISILAGDSPSISADGCAALGGLLQFTVIVQFVWILALVSTTAAIHSFVSISFVSFLCIRNNMMLILYPLSLPPPPSLPLLQSPPRLLLSGSTSWVLPMVESH